MCVRESLTLLLPVRGECEGVSGDLQDLLAHLLSVQDECERVSRRMMQRLGYFLQAV